MFAEKAVRSYRERQPGSRFDTTYPSSDQDDRTTLPNAIDDTRVLRSPANAFLSSTTTRPTQRSTEGAVAARNYVQDKPQGSGREDVSTRASRQPDDLAMQPQQEPQRIPGRKPTPEVLPERGQESRETPVPQRVSESRPRCPNTETPVKTEKPKGQPPPVAPKPSHLAVRAAKYLTIGAVPSRKDRSRDTSAERCSKRQNGKAIQSILRIPADVKRERVTRRRSSSEQSPHRQAETAEYLRENVLYTKVKMPPIDLPLSGNRHLIRGSHTKNGDLSLIRFYLPSPPDPPELTDSVIHGAQSARISSRSPSPPLPEASVRSTNFTEPLRRKHRDESAAGKMPQVDRRAPAGQWTASEAATLNMGNPAEAQTGFRSPSLPNRLAAELSDKLVALRRKDITERVSDHREGGNQAQPAKTTSFRSDDNASDGTGGHYESKKPPSTGSVSSYIQPHVRSVAPQKPIFSNDAHHDEVLLIPPSVPPLKVRQLLLRAKSRTSPVPAGDVAPLRPHSSNSTDFPAPPDPADLAQYATSQAFSTNFFGESVEQGQSPNKPITTPSDSSSANEADLRQHSFQKHKAKSDKKQNKKSQRHPPVTVRPQSVAATKRPITEHDRPKTKSAAKSSQSVQQNVVPLQKPLRPRSRVSSAASSDSESIVSSKGQSPVNYVAVSRPSRKVHEEAILRDEVSLPQDLLRMSERLQTRKPAQVLDEILLRPKLKVPSSYADTEISQGNDATEAKPEPEPKPTTLYGYWGEEGPISAARRIEAFRGRTKERDVVGQESDASSEAIGIPESLSGYADYKKILQEAIDETADPDEPVRLRGYWGDAEQITESRRPSRRHFSRYFTDSPEIHLSNPFRLLERQSQSPRSLSDSGHSDEESAPSSPDVSSRVARTLWPNGQGHQSGEAIQGNSNVANQSDGEVKGNNPVAESLRRIPSICKKDLPKDLGAGRDKSPLRRYQDQPLSKPGDRYASEGRIASRVHPPNSVTPPAARDSGISDTTTESLAFYDLPASVYVNGTEQFSSGQRWSSDLSLYKPSTALRSSIRFQEPPVSTKPHRNSGCGPGDLRRTKGMPSSTDPPVERVNVHVSKAQHCRYDPLEFCMPSVRNPKDVRKPIERHSNARYGSSPQLALTEKRGAPNHFAVDSHLQQARTTRFEPAKQRTPEWNTIHHRIRQPSLDLSISSRRESSSISQTDSPDSSVHEPYRLSQRSRVEREPQVTTKVDFEGGPDSTSLPRKPVPRLPVAPTKSATSYTRADLVQAHTAPQLPQIIPREVRPVERYSPTQSRRTPKHPDKPTTLPRSIRSAPAIHRISGAW